MKFAQSLSRKSAGLATLVALSSLVLSACATSAPAPGQTASASHAQGSLTRAKSDHCMAMHEHMMSNMSDEGASKPHQMMSPELMAQHKACMQAMPEMRAQMQERCDQMAAQEAASGGGRHAPTLNDDAGRR